MKLTTTTMVTLDGVMQGLGAREEDTSGGFDRGGWIAPVFDSEAAAFLNEDFQRADAFLFGRRTYEIFAGSWGVMDDPSASPVGEALNTKPKYLVSTTITNPQWADTTVIADDVETAVRGLKAAPGRELQVHGSGALLRWLLEHDLIDELNVLTVPVVLGKGTRLFPETGPDLAFDLVDSKVTPKGVIIQVYRPAGKAVYAEASMSDLE
jgi:dihydrofolate reductase